MPGWRLVALLCLVAAAAGDAALAASPYIVDGVALGGPFEAQREHNCQPSEQFPGFTWCQRKQSQGRGGAGATSSVIHRIDGGVAYVSRRVTPAFFSGSDIQNEIKRLTERLGERPRVLRLPRREGVANAVIALWGQIELELVEGAELAALAAGGPSQRGLLIDYLGEVNRSAELGLPVFRLVGEAGYLWSARHDEKGRGTLRFLAIDASALAAPPRPASTPPVASATPDLPAPPIATVVPDLPAPPSVTPSRTEPPLPPLHDEPDPEPVATIVPPEPTVMKQPEQPSADTPVQRSGALLAAPPVSTAPAGAAILALLVTGLVMARRRWVARARREALYAALYPRAAAAPAIAVGPPLRSYASGGILMALAILIYVCSQSPMAVRNMLGLFGSSSTTPG